MSSGQIFYGGTVERSRDGTTWVRVRQVESFELPEIEVSKVDITNLDSPNGFREYVQGLAEIPDITITTFYSAEGLEEALDDDAWSNTNATPITYRLTLKPTATQLTGTSVKFDAFPKSNLVTGGMEDPNKIAIKLTPTGAPVYTHGTPKP